MARVGGSGDESTAVDRFAAPQPAEGLALRSGVLEGLSAPTTRVGVITAPGGYGKSSHAAAWADQDGRPVAWIDLDAGHDDAHVLLDDLVAALGSVTDFNPDGLPTGGATPDQYATQVAVTLGRTVRACAVPFVLVLDDVHCVQDVSASDLIGALVSNVPLGCAVLLVGRGCHVGDVKRLRVERHLVEVGVGDLALDVEGVTLVLDTMGLDVSTVQASGVVADTEGWPVGVRLAGMARLAEGGEEVEEPFAGMGRDGGVSDYLETQWLVELTEDERRVLTRTSPLDWLSGSLCNEVLERNDAGEVLHNVVRNRMLLIPLDLRRGEYRMHGLLREALEAEFERTDASGIRQVHHRASAWFETAGDIDRAVRHAVAAEEFDRAATLVTEHTPALYTSGRYTTIERWVESLPRDLVVGNPMLCVCAALAALGRAEADALAVWLRVGDHAVASTSEVDTLAGLCLRDIRSTTSPGPVGPALDDAAAAHRGLPPGIWHAASCVALGAWHWMAGGDEAVEVLTAGAEEAAVFGAPSLEAHCCALLAMIAYTERDPARAWPLVKRAWRVVAEHGLEHAPGIAMIRSMSALASAATGDPDGARESWQVARNQLAMIADLSGWANVQPRITLAQVGLLLGDRIGSETMLREAREWLVRMPDASRALRQVAELEESAKNLRRHSGTGGSALTTAELRVLRYLPTNLSLAEIGTRLYVSRYTVKTHCGSIYRKLDVRSRSEAVNVARDLGLLDSADNVGLL